MSLTVHVGLAKCASTSLQRFVFPELKKIDRNIEFNDENLTFLSYKCHVTPLNSSESCLFNKVLNNGKDHIVSSEFLINRDPFQWEESADINLEMFGKEANIVIIIKDTLPYLTSLYLQIIQEGRCISEKDFFDSGKALCNRRNELRYFSPDSFQLEKLHKIYTERFNNVFFVPISQVERLTFIQDIYNISNSQLFFLQDVFKNSPRINRSYSALSVKLSLKKEYFFNFFGINSHGVCNAPEQKIKKNSSKNYYTKPFLSRFNWRYFLQNILDKIVPYTIFKLQEELNISKQVLKENSIYLTKIEKSNRFTASSQK